MTFKAGLTIPKKKQITNAFGNQDSEDEEPVVQPTKPRMTFKDAMSTKAEMEKGRAIKEDPNVFDYDALYDDMKHQELLRKKAKQGALDEDGRPKPKYIHNIIKAAELRKLEQERIEDRKIKRERELEGDLYGDKEKFVTSAYKDKIEELKRLEEEEKKRIEDDKKGRDMTGFYRNLLDMNDRVVLPTKIVKKNVEDNEKEEENDQNLDKLAKAGVLKLNADEEVVDKRQLLSAGLNVSKKKLSQIEREKQEAEEALRQRKKAEGKARQERELELERRRKAREDAQRAREYVLEQKAERDKEQELKRKQELEEFAMKMSRKTDDQTVTDARARYLARKKVMENQEESESD